MPIVLAHGALGIWDEIIFIAVALLFLAFMVMSWIRARANNDVLQSPQNEPESESPEQTTGRFELD